MRTKTFIEPIIELWRLPPIYIYNHAVQDGDGNWTFWNMPVTEEGVKRFYLEGSGCGIVCPAGKVGDRLGNDRIVSVKPEKRNGLWHWVVELEPITVNHSPGVFQLGDW